jgi:AraC-like DNA-binding protein
MRPLPYANPPLKKHLEHFLLTRSKATNQLEQRLRELISDALPRLISLEEVAGILHLGVRTLQRHLRQNETSFLSIQNDERKYRAIQLLEAGGLTLKETAHACGFADANSFFRTFKKWTGESPGKWKNRKH